MRRVWTLLAVAGAALGSVTTASADNWLPHPADATWTYTWSDSAYQTVPTDEQVTVQSSAGNAFTLAWTTDGLNNPDGAAQSAGTVSFQDGDSGLVTTDWSSSSPPPGFPVLCPSASSCGNSLASSLYNVIWGSKTPTLDEPLVQGLTWTSTGGVSNEVTASNTYLGQQQVTVPAFPTPVTAAVVRSDITQSGGALGDPYGSGVRTVWWVWGVGPVKVVFDHAGGSNPPTTTVVLKQTSLAPSPPPSDLVYFPFVKGKTLTYRWTNPRYLKQPEVEKVTTSGVSTTGSATFSVTSVSGPIQIVGAAYDYTLRESGLISVWATTETKTVAKFPPLGPKALPVSQRRHFRTPLDLMDFGFSEVLEAYPAAGDKWAEGTSGRDYEIYGVNGTTTVLGIQKVTVPAGTFQALAVTTTMTERGFPFGSGTRTSWFAAGKGLVKLVFRHGDGSVSTVTLLK
jgi:hypothetical protein